MSTFVLIPARGGSKGISRKNIKLYKGEPLIAHSIKIAKECPLIDRVFVSTDDEEIAEISIKYGAEVPFRRPANISGDLSTDLECFEHFVFWCARNNILPKMIIHLRPTYPKRTQKLLKDCIEAFQKSEGYSSLRTITPSPASPFKMYSIEENILKPIFKHGYNSPRQILPQTYQHNGCIDIMTPTTIINGSMSGHKILPFLMDENYDIDTKEEFERSELNS